MNLPQKPTREASLGMALLHVQNRPLNEKERRYLKAQRATLARRRDTLLRRIILACAIISGLLATLTALDERKHIVIIFASWAVVGSALSICAYIPERRKLSRGLGGYEHALASGICAERQIRAKRMWEFEEQEDEGACYAFELEAGGVAFVVGQEFYGGARFPNSDFSIVEFHSSKGEMIDFLIEKRGVKLAAERVISSEEKERLDIPENGTYLNGTLEQVYARLRRA